MEYVQHLYDGQLSLGLYGIKSNCNSACGVLVIVKSLLAIGFHPEQISHSLIALFINCKQYVPESNWDESIQTNIQGIIVEIAKHNAEYSTSTLSLSSSSHLFCSSFWFLRVSCRRSWSLWDLFGHTRILWRYSRVCIIKWMSSVPSGTHQE